MARGPAIPLCRYADPLIEDLRKQIPRALAEWDADAIHDARVSTRRLRAVLDLLDPAVPAKLLSPLRRTLRRLRRTLGELRDIDVMLKLLSPLINHPKHGAAAGWAHSCLLDRRNSERRKAKGKKKRSPAALIGRLDAWQPLREQIVSLGGVTEELMVASLGAQWNNFASMTRQADLFRPQDPHELRIAGKLLRYTFEMLRCTRDKPPAAVVRTFKRMQDALGDWHDHVVLADWMMRLSLRELLAHHDPAMQGKVLALADFAIGRSNRALKHFMTLWEKRGAQIADVVEEIVSRPRTGPDRGGSGPPTAPALVPPSESSAA
jgi:CHAD domain-containing protein